MSIRVRKNVMMEIWNSIIHNNLAWVFSSHNSIEMLFSIRFWIFWYLPLLFLISLFFFHFINFDNKKFTDMRDAIFPPFDFSLIPLFPPRSKSFFCGRRLTELLNWDGAKHFLGKESDEKIRSGWSWRRWTEEFHPLWKSYNFIKSFS